MGDRVPTRRDDRGPGIKEANSPLGGSCNPHSHEAWTGHMVPQGQQAGTHLKLQMSPLKICPKTTHKGSCVFLEYEASLVLHRVGAPDSVVTDQDSYFQTCSIPSCLLVPQLACEQRLSSDHLQRV